MNDYEYPEYWEARFDPWGRCLTCGNWGGTNTEVGITPEETYRTDTGMNWRQQHAIWHRTIMAVALTQVRKANQTMSDVKWCDLGDHAFKAGVEGSGGYTGTQYGPDGAAHQGRIDHCPNHKPGTFRALPAGRDEGVDEAPELYRENG